MLPSQEFSDSMTDAVYTTLVCIIIDFVIASSLFIDFSCDTN